MPFTNVEILALILVAVFVIKMIAIFVSPKKYMKFAKSFYKNQQMTQNVFFVLAAVVLYFLYSSGVSIVTVFAVMLFASMIIGASMVPYVDGILKQVKPKNMVKDNVILILIWAVLALWVLKEIFM